MAEHSEDPFKRGRSPNKRHVFGEDCDKGMVASFAGSTNAPPKSWAGGFVLTIESLRALVNQSSALFLRLYLAM